MTSEWGTPNMVKNGLDPEFCSEASTVTRSTSGISTNGAIRKNWTWAPNNRWCWSFARPTIPTRLTDLSASSFRSRIFVLNLDVVSRRRRK